MKTLSKTIGVCECCQREARLEFHHLIPRKNHRKAHFRKNYELNDMRTRGIMVCNDCHRAIHRFFNEMQLGKSLNTLSLLMATDEMQKFIEWVQKRRIKIRL